MNDDPRYRIDDLRKFAIALAARAGVAPIRSASLAGHLLWYDAAGAPAFGIATLPGCLERIEAGKVDPKTQGRLQSEHAGTAVLDGQSGVPPLILARAASLASEKARDLGVALIRVVNLGPMGPAAAIAADLAIGPQIALIVGPDASFTLALPSAEGLPAVFDSVLAAAQARTAPGGNLAALVARLAGLAPETGWLVHAIAVPALEPLATFHERVSAVFKDCPEGPGQLLPRHWEARRTETRQRGIALAPALLGALKQWADRYGIEPPAPPGE